MSILDRRRIPRSSARASPARSGLFHSKKALAYGTKMVAGVTPGKGGQTIEGVPVFDTVAEAKEATGATVSMIYVPAPFTADAICEAVDAGIDLAVTITEGVPVADMAWSRTSPKRQRHAADRPQLPRHHHAGDRRQRLQDRHHAGLHPQAGRVGVVSRSGTLTYEAVWQVTSWAGPVDVRRHRRRPDQGHQLHRVPEAVPGRPRHRGHHHDR